MCNGSFDGFGGSDRVKQGFLGGNEKLTLKKEEVHEGNAYYYSVTVCTQSIGPHRQNLKVVFLL